MNYRRSTRVNTGANRHKPNRDLRSPTHHCTQLFTHLFANCKHRSPVHESATAYSFSSGSPHASPPCVTGHVQQRQPRANEPRRTVLWLILKARVAERNIGEGPST